jgi:nucleoside-diphosphate-sugar epimerase
MSHILVTGAQGFVGQALVQRLLEQGLDGHPVERLTALDLAFDAPHPDLRVRQLAGSIADPALRREACGQPVDAVFHLASIPGGAAEKNYELGRDINLEATLGLLEAMRDQPRPPRFVFASSVAVYGAEMPQRVDARTQPAPGLTYGAHKLIGEILVADASRRGWVAGCSLRVPGVVARPGNGEGLISAYMSRLFWCLAGGEPITVPVGPHGKSWWISVEACVDNLLLAASLPPERLNPQRCYQMPAAWLSVAEIVEALSRRFGPQCKSLVRYAPDANVERLFASYPALDTEEAEALGFAHDGTPERLVEHALACLG